MSSILENNPLSQSCVILPGVGPILAEKLARCGIHSIADLLFHLPYRYQDRTRVTPIHDLRAQEYSVIVGKISKTEIISKRKPMLYCYIEDKTGIMRLRFFHFNRQQAQTLQRGQWLSAFGEVHAYQNLFEMIHPEYRLLDDEQYLAVEECLTPIYPATEGLGQPRLRQLISFALEHCQEALKEFEWLSAEQIIRLQVMPFHQALSLLHRPPPDISFQALENGTHPALKRLILDELIAQQVSLQFAKQRLQTFKAPAMPACGTLTEQLLKQLPFTLTNAQQRVSQEIAQEMARNKPMLRLVQGDVGAGKTVVAALAALHAIAAGYQVALMAPTDLLTEQHAAQFQRWLSPLGIHCARLSGQMGAKERKKTLAELADGRCHIAIGTHALFQETVQFAQLGFVIIDEQHRFGVQQRLLLQQKGQKEHITPHQLLMTATPIPRTLAMSHFSHMDLSIIDELPPGRTPIMTKVFAQNKRDDIIIRLKHAIAQGRQIYWVCPLIEESEKLQCMAATVTAETLREHLAPARIGLVHGRLKPLEKEQIMHAFKRGDLDVLVATTVIEVGVDVPNASLMIIENAERLGLSQLHQLRGRVGRGSIESHCLLLYQAPLSHHSQERLHIMRATTDGFLIAEKDLALRGAGELLGVQQTGYKAYKLADLQRDKALLPLAKHLAQELMQPYYPKEQALTIAKRWLGAFECYLQG